MAGVGRKNMGGMSVFAFTNHGGWMKFIINKGAAVTI